jgi:hypothetical protein
MTENHTLTAHVSPQKLLTLHAYYHKARDGLFLVRDSMANITGI